MTVQIAQAAGRLAFDALPAAVLSTARHLLGDLVLAAAVGQAEASTRAFGAALGAAPGRCQIWFGSPGQHVAPADATFANTLSAAAVDYDSLNATVHADLVTLPAAWAMAEHCQRSPRQFLVAYIAGAELVSRLSRNAQGASRGWSPTSLYGGMGAALASGMLLGLNCEQQAYALGLAAAQAAGSQQANLEQTLAKRLQPALAARNGVQAALLAQAGASAPRQALEGRFGLRALYQPGDDSGLLAGWGTDWQLLDTAIKRFPVCACSHAALQALLDLRERVPFDSDAVLHITAIISPFMQRLVGGAFDPQADLQVLAQFNLRYQLASVCVRGPFTLDHLLPGAVLDPIVVAQLPKVQLRVDEANLEELAPAEVEVRLRDGRVLTQRCAYLPGSPQAPLSAAQRRAKALECGEQASPPVDGEHLLAQLARLDQRARLPSLQPTALTSADSKDEHDL